MGNTLKLKHGLVWAKINMYTLSNGISINSNEEMD